MASISGASSVSGQKSSPKTPPDTRSKSCDTNCSSNSSCFFKKKKPPNPLAYPIRPFHQKTANNNPVKQRVMSAKLLKLKQLQSQLNDANFHLAEVARENQVLKTLQKRQDKALSKYEDTNADLPRLIRSYEEEVRVLNEKNRALKRNVRELGDQVKLKDEELTRVREHLAHLEKLDKDKRLSEREKLAEQLEDIKMQLERSDEQVSLLNRKLLVESKASKQRLNAEIVRHKQCQKELLHAFDEIDRLTGLLEAKENVARHRTIKFQASKHNQQSISKVNLQAPVSEVKLEPLVNDKEALRKNQNNFKAPIENIRQRLSSSNSAESRDNSAGSIKSRPNSSIKLPSMHETNGKLRFADNAEEIEQTIEKNDHNKDENASQMASNASSNESLEDMLYKMKKDKQTEEQKLQNRRTNEEAADSEKDIETLAGNLDAAIQKAAERSQDDFDKNLSSYCSEVLTSVKSCNKAIELHKEGLKDAKKDTNTLLESLKKTEKIESKLKHSFFSLDDDMDLVKQILNEEHNFQVERKARNKEAKPLVNTENKKKLLATLRAIDNGDSVESVGELREEHVVRGIYGNAAAH